MTVAEELKNCLLLYPTIFPNKWSVYHHWFVTIGNGYHWFEGELVIPSQKDKVTVEDAVQKHFDCFLSDECLLRSPKYNTQSCKQSIMLSLQWEERSKDFTKPRGCTLSKICTYSAIANIPANIKPDWLEAAKEFHRWLRMNSSGLPKNELVLLETCKNLGLEHPE